MVWGETVIVEFRHIGYLVFLLLKLNK